MSKDLNKIQIIGRLGKDPEMRFTPNGSAVTTFTVATGRQWKDPNGENREETEWHTVVAWNKLGEICNQYLVKGSRVYVEGRLQTRSWDDKTTGDKKYKTEIIANDMIILDGRNEAPVGHEDAGDPNDFEDHTAAAQHRAPAAAPGRAPAPTGRSAGRPAAAAPAATTRGGRKPVTEEDDLPF